MGKYIKLTDEFMEQTRRDFEEALRMAKLSDGKFNFTKTFTKPGKDKAKVYFTPTAWVKMLTLLGGFDKEVAWHGVATRYGNEDDDEYMISDILVYPQEVTGATVTTDRLEYQTWLMAQPDEVFNNIRMQGHSHVNMGTSPSSVDLRDQDGILAQLEDDMFYIFMIYNKRLEFWVKVFDMKKNTVFEKEEVTVAIREDDVDFSEFLKTAKTIVKEKTYQTPAAKQGGFAGGYYESTQYHNTPVFNDPPKQIPAASANKPEQTSPAKAVEPQKPAEKKIQRLSDGAGYQYPFNNKRFYDYDAYMGAYYQ